MDGVLPGCIGARVLVSRITWCAPRRADNVVISAYGFQGPRAFVISAVATLTGVGGLEEGRTTEEENSGRSSIHQPLFSSHLRLFPMHGYFHAWFSSVQRNVNIKFTRDWRDLSRCCVSIMSKTFRTSRSVWQNRVPETGKSRGNSKLLFSIVWTAR